jgi:hypothetical protein
MSFRWHTNWNTKKRQIESDPMSYFRSVSFFLFFFNTYENNKQLDTTNILSKVSLARVKWPSVNRHDSCRSLFTLLYLLYYKLLLLSSHRNTIRCRSLDWLTAIVVILNERLKAYYPPTLLNWSQSCGRLSSCVYVFHLTSFYCLHYSHAHFDH